MYRKKYSHPYHFIIFSLFTRTVFPHGFPAHQTISVTNEVQKRWIGHIAQDVGYGEKIRVPSMDPITKHVNNNASVKMAGCSIVNEHQCIAFVNNVSQPIQCTILQPFFRIQDQQWVCAYMLQPGDRLLCKNGSYVEIARSDLIHQPLKVYTLEVNGTHIFFVGEQDILAHNMVFIPAAVSVGISIPFDILGFGTASIVFGPIGLAVGVTMGGVACYVAYKMQQQPRWSEYNVQSIHDRSAAATLTTSNHENDWSLAFHQENSNQRNTTSNNRSTQNSSPGQPQDPKERKKNTITKTEFFNKPTVKEQYKYYKDGKYKRNHGARGIENAEYLQWDNLHQDVEAYDKSGRYLGSIEPESLKLYKSPAFPPRVYKP